MHMESHPMAGAMVIVEMEHPQLEGTRHEFRVEDWWDKLTGGSWMFADGNPAALIYAMRAGMRDPALPTDDEVVYGKIGALGHLVHVSEIVGSPEEAE